MNPTITSYFQFKQRLGLHYFPDTLHYRDQDFQAWLPVLKSLHISWIVLLAPLDRAIPESFVKGLVENKIAPVLHFDTMPEKLIETSELEPLMQAYARWGVKNAIFFNQPNMRSSWSVPKWTQKNLVDQFLDRFIPAANLAVQNGVHPVFPPLYHGGDYWDTIFLRSALSKIQEKADFLTNKLQLSSFAWSQGKPLDWGSGGLDRWPNARPYSQQEDPDQRGFRNFEWYTNIAETILGVRLPVHLLGAGLSYPPGTQPGGTGDDAFQADENQIMAEAFLAAGEKSPVPENAENTPEPLSDNVASVNFWLLSTSPEDALHPYAWFETPGNPRPAASRFLEWAAGAYDKDEKLWRDKKRLMNLQGTHHAQDAAVQSHPAPKPPFTPAEYPRQQVLTPSAKTIPQPSISEPGWKKPAVSHTPAVGDPASPAAGTKQPLPGARKTGLIKPIEHYLLLPRYEWGISDWHLEVIKPFIKKHQVTVGFSIKEAALAKRVTIVGNRQSFSDELLEKLRSIGCEVDRIQGDGTSIASQLATR